MLWQGPSYLSGGLQILVSAPLFGKDFHFWLVFFQMGWFQPPKNSTCIHCIYTHPYKKRQSAFQKTAPTESHLSGRSYGNSPWKQMGETRSLRKQMWGMKLPIPSMYGIFTYIWLIFMVNVGKYTIHGLFGLYHFFDFWKLLKLFFFNYHLDTSYDKNQKQYTVDPFYILMGMHIYIILYS